MWPWAPAFAGETSLYLPSRSLRSSAPFAFRTFVIPDLIRDPGQQERLVRVALNTRQQGDGEGDACSETLRASG